MKNKNQRREKEKCQMSNVKKNLNWKISTGKWKAKYENTKTKNTLSKNWKRNKEIERKKYRKEMKYKTTIENAKENLKTRNKLGLRCAKLRKA